MPLGYIMMRGFLDYKHSAFPCFRTSSMLSMVDRLALPVPHHISFLHASFLLAFQKSQQRYCGHESET
jgi:hypothetical protein